MNNQDLLMFGGLLLVIYAISKKGFGENRTGDDQGTAFGARFRGPLDQRIAYGSRLIDNKNNAFIYSRYYNQNEQFGPSRV